MRPVVLIIDDSLTVRMELAEGFEAAGFKTVLCTTLEQGRHELSSAPFDLVVLDVVLPDGDGVDFLREVRDSTPVPILLLSTEAEVRDRIRGMKMGADDYVGKPYDLSYVLSRAKELVRKKEAKASGPEAVKVLLIDDSATFRKSLQESLGRVGYSTATAESGEEGLRLAADLRPDAIIVDGMLPGMDGATVIRQIRLDAGLRRTPCLLLTGSGDRIEEVRALDSGADSFVRKEEDLDVILVRLSAILRSAKTPAAVASSSTLLGPKRILAVDDSPTYLNELAAQLRQEDYEVVLAGSGAEALELLAVQSVDCILLDLVMPSMSGQEVCRQIKSSPIWRNTPLIMLTAREDREAMIEGINLGADDYISKSNDFEVLKARLKAQLRRKQFEDENRDIRSELLRKELEAAEARAARELAAARAELLADVQRKNEELKHANAELKTLNQELESFSYSVSHDLRAPLRSIDGFSEAVLQDYSDKLDETGKEYLRRLREASQRMAELIDDILGLAKVVRAEMRRDDVDLSALAESIVHKLRTDEPERRVTFTCSPGLRARVDKRLMNIALVNLLGNAWKFTSKTPQAVIEFGAESTPEKAVYWVKDNGAGFNPAYAQKLFAPFQRLHSTAEFPGTGIGLATVQRVLRRHGGEIWAESRPGHGATFYFRLE